MAKRIRIIFVLVTISLVGIVLLQAYWLRNSYSVNREQLLKEVNLFLEQSRLKDLEFRMSRYTNKFFVGSERKLLQIPDDETLQKRFGDLFSKYDSLANSLFESKGIGNKDSVTISINSPLSFSNNVTNNFGRVEESSTMMGKIIQTTDSCYDELKTNHNGKAISDLILGPDSVSKALRIDLSDVLFSIIKEEMAYDIFGNISGIDSLFAQQMKEMNYDFPYYLEIIRTDNDSIEYSTMKNLSDTTNSMLSKSFPTDVMGTYCVRIRIPNGPQVILERMSLGLLGAFVLILMVMGCFFYMINTIFKQKQLSEVKNDFINNMTHELKTPIATVSAAVEAMQNFGVLDDKEKTELYLNISQKELKRLSRLVEKVLNMAREERKVVKMHFEDVKLKELCYQITDGQQIKDLEKNVSFAIDFEDHFGTIWVDRTHFSNVLQNLIENSIKYSNDEVNIKIRAYHETSYSVVEVSDNGWGIPKKHLSKIFDQFYRIPSGNIHDVKGFGLGLFYVNKIVEKHGGRIFVTSVEGEGTTFIIKIPRN